jgi:uncharacterized RDD family membrane protein YckC
MTQAPAVVPLPVAAVDSLDGRLVTGEAVALDLRPTSFVLRAAGAAIDFVAYFIVLYVGTAALLFSIVDAFALDAAIAAASVGLSVICLVVVPTAFEILTHGRSPGRFAVGARIVLDDGGAIGFRHALIRSLTGYFELFLTFGGMAAVTGLLNEKSKRLGDYVAGTYSQYERVPRIQPPVFDVPAALVPWSQTADVARMPDRLARRIAQFLRQAATLSPLSRERLAAGLAAEASAYVSPVPAVDAETFVVAVAAMRRVRESEALALEARRLELLAPTLTRRPRGFPERG